MVVVVVVAEPIFVGHGHSHGDVYDHDHARGPSRAALAGAWPTRPPSASTISAEVGREFVTDEGREFAPAGLDSARKSSQCCCKVR